MIILFSIIWIIFLLLWLSKAEADDIIEYIRDFQHEVLEKLQASNIKYKKAEDVHCKEHDFPVRDLFMTYFECIPVGAYGKLSKRNYGPFHIIKNLGLNCLSSEATT